MQLTSIDRWLKEKFIYEIQILTLRQASEVPRGMSETELPEKPGRRFRFLYRTGKAQAAEALLATLKEENQMFTTKVVDKEAWWVQFIAPEGKSATWYVTSVFIFMAALTPVVIWIRGLLHSEEFIKNAKDAFELLKG